jgi:thiamine biosynthesis lipoprotein
MQRYEHQFTAMGSSCSVQADHADEDACVAALDAAETEVRRLETKYSRYQQNSLASQINRAAGNLQPTAIDSETAGLLRYAHTLWEQSNGLFDLTSGVLRKAWNFRSGKPAIQADIDTLLPLVDWSSVALTDTSVCLPRPGMELDFGGIVKEYASDSAARCLRNQGILHGLVNLAGDIAVAGPQGDGNNWPIGIRHPREQGHALASISLGAGGLASSGDYERCIEHNGKRYGHILNPATGWPVSGLAAVSVVADQCLVAGSVGTVAMLKPIADALTWLDELGLPWLAIDQEMRCHGNGFSGLD